ncbi:MAG TPA: right-handed parallel beta-helix repeat-containing protein [Pyrinomonadaceae bacterium]|nr:right-handed parallel beta-helix repeat-containing protein [Pyrinomonadaceae bacterium]
MKRLERPNWRKNHQRGRRFWLVLLVGFLLIPLTIGGYFLGGNLIAESKIAINGSTITVRAGGDLQSALDRAKAGDTIVLQAGANFVGSFTLPNKAGSEFITIQSSELAKLPKDGVRVSPADAAQMPKILSPGGGIPAIKTAPNAHHYRFVGIEFAPGGADYVYNLIALGSDSQKAEEMPKTFEIDRCYIHPNPKGKTRRGIALNSADTVIKNSYIAGFAYREEETQAIAGWNGSGGYKIINNYLEAGAENLIIGGSDPSIKNLVPTDIEIRNNLMSKPAEWRGKVTIKCTFELKNARNVRVIGNIIENSFDENAVRITIRNQEGSAPWSVIEDVVFQNNIVRNSGGGVNFLGKDDLYPSGVMKRVAVVNNLFENIDSQKFGGDGRFVVISNGEDITVANNTVFHDGNVITAHGDASKRFVFRNNIFSNNAYGFAGEGVIGKGVFAKYLSDSTVSDNVIVNGKSIPKSDIYVPPRNALVDGFDAVGFVGWQTGNYRLAPNSKFKDKKIGCDIDALETEIRKVQKK